MSQLIRRSYENGVRVFKCLVIDDDVMDRKIAMRSLMDARENIEIDCAETIRKGRELLICGTYDLVLVDHHLPDGFGGEFLNECVVAGVLRWGQAVLLTAIPDHAAELLAASEKTVGVMDKKDLSATRLAEIMADVERKLKLA